jgi:hypothetical protein
MTLATNPAGSQVLLTQPPPEQLRPLFAATRDPGGGFSPLRAIGPPPGVFEVRAAVDDNGGAVAAWLSRDPQNVRPDRLFASVRAPGAPFGPPMQLLEEPFNHSPTLAANAAGDAIVGWGPPAQTARNAYRRAGEAFGIPGTLSVGPGTFIGFSVDPDGTVHAFSEDINDDRSSDIYEWIRPPGGDFGPPALVRHLAFSGGAVLTAARSGRVLILWHADGAIKGIDRAPGGAFSAPFAVPTGPVSTNIEEDAPSIAGVAVAPSGAAIVSILVDHGVYVLAARKRPGGAFVLSPRIKDEPHVAVDDAGDAAAAWRTSRFAVRGMYRPHGKAHFNGRITLAGVRPHGRLLETPSVAISDSGRATAAWQLHDSAAVSVVARDFRDSRAGRREVVGVLPTFVREGPPGACRPAGAQLLRSGAQSTVFVSGNSFGCLLARGVPVRLDFDSKLEPPSTMSLAGPLVGYGRVRSDGAARFKVFDLRDPQLGVNRTSKLDRPRPAFLVTSRLKPNGAAAWIACPRLGKTGESRSRCRRKGGMTKHVFAWVSSSIEPRLVDSGRTIDPGTFRLRGWQLSWRHGKKLHHARLR